MRISIGLAFVVVAACGKSPGSGGGGGGGGGGGPDAPSDLGTPVFQITSTDLTIDVSPNNEVTKCFYFHTGNTATAAVNKWVSHMTPGSHHMIMFLNPGGSQPADGTIDENCGLGGSGGGANIPVWTYATQMPDQEEDLPPDDGTGMPLAQNIPANTAGYFQMHYLNETDSPIQVHVELSAYALPTGTPYTETEAYITYNNSMSIPPHAVPPAAGTSWTASCPVPAGKKFWLLSSHSHKQDMTTDVMDGATDLVHSDDWQHPPAQEWNTTPFYTFTNTDLTWNCTYANTGDNANNTVVAGQSAQTNEMCMATGYFFPATAPAFGIYLGGTGNNDGTCITQ